MSCLGKGGVACRMDHISCHRYISGSIDFHKAHRAGIML